MNKEENEIGLAEAAQLLRLPYQAPIGWYSSAH
jgi:hypothetical protein